MHDRDDFHGRLGELLRAVRGGDLRVLDSRPVGGGCIHDARVIETTAHERLFVKQGPATQADVFAAEADGLEALARSGAVRIPRVVARETWDDVAVLVLEYLAIGSGGDPAQLGEALATLHASQGDAFGWHRDNYIGPTPQTNVRTASWCRFWEEQRLAPLAERLAAAGEKRTADAVQRLLPELPVLLADHHPAPSLLHGDLWAGNAGYTSSGEPVLFDPAVYHGDREADIAMTELFGGFPQRFHDAYTAVNPLSDGYRVRRELYNLYHVLNHALLFGGGYGSRARDMVAGLLAETGR